MATSQMTAAATRGRYMSDLVKSVSPALKLMNVLTTATDASEMPVAAGIPSSRTRPDVCRMNSRVGWALPVWVPPVWAAPAGTDASLLVTGLPPAAASPGRGTPEPGFTSPDGSSGCPYGQARTRDCQYLRTYGCDEVTKPRGTSGKAVSAARKTTGVLFDPNFRYAVTMQ